MGDRRKNEYAALMERYYQDKAYVLGAETCLSATLSTPSPTQSGLASNQKWDVKV